MFQFVIFFIELKDDGHLKTDVDGHLKSKDLARKLKRKTREKKKQERVEVHILAEFDLQVVLGCPKANSRYLYWKRHCFSWVNSVKCVLNEAPAKGTR